MRKVKLPASQCGNDLFEDLEPQEKEGVVDASLVCHWRHILEGTVYGLFKQELEEREQCVHVAKVTLPVEKLRASHGRMQFSRTNALGPRANGERGAFTQFISGGSGLVSQQVKGTGDEADGCR